MSAAVIRAVARGVIIANYRSLLLENGDIDLSTGWLRQVLYRFENLVQKMISRMATTAKIPVAPALLSETKLYFQRKIKELQAWHEFPEDLIINFDQTPLSYVCTGKRTCHTQNASNVPLVGKAKKVNYRYLHNNYVWAVSTNASHLSREHRLLTAKRCRVCR